MRLTASQLSAHLSKSLAPLYVVAGEEPLLVQESLDAIRAAARRQGFSEREVLDADKNFDWNRLLQACASLSLFAERRIIEINLPSGAPGTEGSKVLQAYAQQAPQDTLLILVCGAMEWRNRQAAWYTALEQAGASLYFEAIKSAELPAWIAARFKRAGLNADEDAIAELAERTEGNLLAAAQDIEKLKLLFPGGTLTAADLARAVADSARFEAFDFNDLMLSGEPAAAVRSLNRLREEGTSPLELLGALSYSLRLLVKASLIYAQSRDAGVACDRAGVRKTSRPVFSKALARVSPPMALGLVSRCARIDQMVKTGQEAAAWEELLKLSLQLSGAPAKRVA